MKQRLVAMIGLVGALTITTASAEEAPDFLTIGGGPQGGFDNIVASAVGEILRDVYPDTTIDVQPGGTGPNILRLSKDQIDIGLTRSNNMADALAGRDPAPEGQPIENVRGIMTLYEGAAQLWVPENSDIDSYDDLVGKRFSASAPGQAAWQTFDNIMSLYGTSLEELEKTSSVEKLSWSESTAALADGQLDAVFWVTSAPHSAMVEVETRQPVKLVSMEDDKIEEYLEKFGDGFYRTTLPAGTYKGQKKDAETLATVTYLAVNESMSDEMAYSITKALWEHADRLKAAGAVLSYIDKDTVAKNMAIPLHPGAAEFYSEAGIPTE